MKRWLCSAVVLSACGGHTAPPLEAPTRVESPVAAVAPSWRAEVPAPGAATRVEYPVPEISRLDSGLSIWVVRRPARVASVSVVVRHGQSSVPPKKSGLAALTARMLTESTKDKSSSELAEAVESLGTTLSHDAGRDYSLVGMTVLASDVERAVELLGEVVQRPRFAADELDRVRGEWIDGLLAERQNPGRLASLAALRVVLGEPHGAPVAGSVSDVKQLEIKDVRAFHARAWTADAAGLLVVGDVEPARVRAAAERALGRWRKATAKAPKLEAFDPPAAPTRARVVVVDRPGSVQSAIFAAQSFPRRDAPGHEARQLLSAALGGLFTSRINANLREKNAFTYGARSQAIATRHWGAFVVFTNVETSVTAPALRELFAEIDAADARPIGADELARARADAVSSLGARLEDVDRVADDLVTTFHLGLAPDYSASLPRLLESLPVAAVHREAARLRPEQMVVVIVGDKAAITPSLSKLPVTIETAAAALVD